MIPGRYLGLTSAVDRGLLFALVMQGMAKCEAGAWVFLHTSNFFSPLVHPAVWWAGVRFRWAQGMVTAQLDSATSPSCFYLFLVKHGNSPVFLERQPLPPQFQVICRMPSAWGRDSPGPGLGDKWGGCPMEAEQHLWVWSSSNK